MYRLVYPFPSDLCSDHPAMLAAGNCLGPHCAGWVESLFFFAFQRHDTVGTSVSPFLLRSSPLGRRPRVSEQLFQDMGHTRGRDRLRSCILNANDRYPIVPKYLSDILISVEETHQSWHSGPCYRHPSHHSPEFFISKRFRFLHAAFCR